MTPRRSVGLLIAGTYFIIVTWTYLGSINFHKEFTNLRFFTTDTEINKTLAAEIVADGNSGRLFITRAFHNKLKAFAGILMTSVYRSLDLPFLFSLTDHSSPYDSEWKLGMMQVWELPWFGFALIILVRRWQNTSNLLKIFLVLATAGSLTVAGLFLPGIQALKLFPLVFTIRFLTGWGIFVFVDKFPVWAKN